MSVKTVSIRVDEDAYNRIVRVQKEMKKENGDKGIAGYVSMADVIRKMDNVDKDDKP